MGLFAISDLHFPSSENKPMDVFGDHWQNHIEKISEDWRRRVSDDDVVLLPGDFSWAMRLRDAVADMEKISGLPGKKVLLRGNHDFWWGSISRVRDALPEGMYAVQNDCVSLGGYVIAGTRGWLLPGSDTTSQDETVYKRELVRLELSLTAAKRVCGDEPPVCMMHFPPLTVADRKTGFTDIIEAFGVKRVYYGHLHGPAVKNAFQGENNGVLYRLVSCDSLGFSLFTE